MAVAGSLRDLEGLRSFYEIPRDDIATPLLIPAMRVAKRVRIMAGFFNSHSFTELAPGLAAFIDGSNEPLELLLSPKISDEDRDAIRRAITDPVKAAEDAIARLFEGTHASESAIASHVHDCLSYLIARDRLVLRFVLMERGMFHPKVWLFVEGDDVMAVHGSNNPTEAGLLYNGETVSVDRAWADGPAARQRIEGLSDMFEGYWHNKREKAITVEAPAGLRFAGDHAVEHVPTVDDFWRAWYEDAKKGLAPPLPEGVAAPVWTGVASSRPSLAVPPELIWETGRFGHQGRAVEAWEASDRRGILAIATGGGKTISSFVAATRLQNEDDTPLLVLVLAPTNPLVDQWVSETRRFGVKPYVLGRMASPERIAELHGVVTALMRGVARTEVLICSNQLFATSGPLREFLRALPSQLRTLLIADEVHNLGIPSFLAAPPEEIRYRIGLSATPLRQYDAEGSQQLIDFFGPIVFEFDLGEAIRAGCLTPYNYRLHEVHLTDEEMDEWRRLTEQLRQKGFFGQDEGQTAGLDPAIQRLLEARRSVLEHSEEKLGTLRGLLLATPPSEVRNTLIYTSAKRDPLGRTKQIVQVNRLLNDIGVLSHQVTYGETGGPRARRILDDFATGKYQSLTCMKVLDEGLDVPATTSAFILASSTVRREWVQRRGRVLRTSPGKSVAEIHDFFVVPPDPDSKDARSIIRAELERADEFARLAENAWDNDGPRRVTERYE
jgi:superfamily II DNA or RNA helicase